MTNLLWEVFLTPHTDDEAIGMAGAITRAHLAGFNTLVVLVTDNLPSARQERIFAMPNLADLRRVEWRKAMKCLLVNELAEWDIPEVDMIGSPHDSQAIIRQSLERLSREHYVSHVHTVMGTDDTHAEVGYGSLSHALCANAASHFARDNPNVKTTLHGVYVYSKAISDREVIGTLTPIRDSLTQKEWSRKRDALDCYRPSDTTIGYGFTSVPELITNASEDPTEYIVEINPC